MFLHIFLFRFAKFCLNNLFKPALVAIEAIVLFVLLCTLDQTGETILKSKIASDIQLLEVKTLIDKSLFWGLSTFYFLILNYFSTSVFQEK
jgi:hypothetical protein